MTKNTPMLVTNTSQVIGKYCLYYNFIALPSTAVMRLEQFPDGFLHVFIQSAPQGL